MGASRQKTKARKAAWIAFGLVTLAALSRAVDHPATANPAAPTNGRLSGAGRESDTESDEAHQAYKQALQALSTLPPLPASQTQGFSFHETQQSSFLSSLYTNHQGPVANAIRIALRLRQQSWLPKFFTSRWGKNGGERKNEEMKGKAIKVIDLLDYATELGHLDAMYTFAQVSLLPPAAIPLNATRAFDLYTRHAALTGNATSQSMVAFFYATGYKDVVPVDQARALLFYTFAAQGGDQGAEMALGYRYWTGISVNDNCMTALGWYEAAAEHAMAKFLSGPPGGRTLPHTTAKLSDLAGGVYGPGASVASTGMNAHRTVIKASTARAAGETWEDVLEYYLYNADRGQTDFAFRLGKIFYQGSIYSAAGGIASGGEGVGAIPRDFARARTYFLRIVRAVWPRDNPGQPLILKKEGVDESTVGYAAASASYLGRMYLRGEGVKQDFEVAKMWFERGAEHGERESHNGLGIIWRDGLVEKSDLKRAFAYFTAAAGQDLAEAQVNLGKYHYQRGETALAITYFETAIRHGSPFEAYYYLAELQTSQAHSYINVPSVVTGSCAISVSFYKFVAERGTWDEDLLRDADLAWRTGTEKGYEAAMVRWGISAERGVETAQNNLAYVLDQNTNMLQFTPFTPVAPSNETARLALLQWTRSAGQRNIDALVKVGDYYYYGLGVPEESEKVRLEKAAGYYQSAVETQMSALAMWNLGWMYENGIGVPQDFHLAKRHYDLALETNSEAYLPVLLALIKLHARSLWHTLLGGEGGLDLWGGDDEYSDRQYDKGGELEQDQRDTKELPGSEVPSSGDHDDSWYMGKAREERNKRIRAVQANDGQLDGEEDPIQWARDRRNADGDRESDFGPEDYFDGALRGGNREDENADEFAETMLLVVLCLMVSALVYVRGRWIERRRREEEQQNGAPPRDGGLFPPPGDPAREEWRILR